MAKPKNVRRLRIYDIQRILFWTFNLSRRPSFLPLRAKDRPSSVNIVKLETLSTDIHRILGRFNIHHAARVNENIPFDMLLDCLLRDGKYEHIAPSLEYIKTENLRFVSMVEFERLYCSEVFVDSEVSPVETDFGRYQRVCRASSHEIVALDVEKVETEDGKELGRVTVVDSRGTVVYDRIVKPRGIVTNYLTRYSGLTEDIVKQGVDIQVVRHEIMNTIGTNTVIVGHGIENDLSSLELYHDRIIDTAHLFLSPEGRKVSLAQLSRTYLGKTIHTDTHDSRIDAITCLELLSVKIQHILNVMDEQGDAVGIEARISSRHIMDLLEPEGGCLNITACTHRELRTFSRMYRTTKDCLWMFLYQTDNKVYICF